MAPEIDEEQVARSRISQRPSRGNGASQKESSTMDSRAWLVMVGFYLLRALQDALPGKRRPKEATATRSHPAPIVQLKPLTQPK